MDYRAGVSEAANNLSGALSGLSATLSATNPNAATISEAQIGAISTAVNAIGSVTVESKRRKALEVIIPIANPVIAQACELLKGELAGLGPIVQLNLDTVRTDLAADYKNARRQMSLDKREARLRQIRRVQEERDAAPKVFAAASMAMEKMKAAHAEATDVVKDGSFNSDTLAALIRDIASFASAIKAVSETTSSTI